MVKAQNCPILRHGYSVPSTLTVHWTTLNKSGQNTHDVKCIICPQTSHRFIHIQNEDLYISFVQWFPNFFNQLFPWPTGPMSATPHEGYDSIHVQGCRVLWRDSLAPLAGFCSSSGSQSSQFGTTALVEGVAHWRWSSRLDARKGDHSHAHCSQFCSHSSQVWNSTLHIQLFACRWQGALHRTLKRQKVNMHIPYMNDISIYPVLCYPYPGITVVRSVLIWVIQLHHSSHRPAAITECIQHWLKGVSGSLLQYCYTGCRFISEHYLKG